MTSFHNELSAITFRCLQFTAATSEPSKVDEEISVVTKMGQLFLEKGSDHHHSEFLHYLDSKVKWIKDHSNQITAADRDCLGVIYNTYLGHFPSSLESTQEIAQIFDKAKILEQLNNAGSISFSEYTKAISNMEYFLNVKKERPDQIRKLINAMHQGSWESMSAAYVEEMEALPWDALAAFEMEKISSYQFTTILIFWAVCIQYSDREILYQRLYDEQGRVYREAKYSINQTVLKDPNALASFRSTVGIAEGIHSDTVGIFFELMKGKPKSECGYFYFETTMPKSQFHQMDLVNENGVDFRIQETRKISEVLLHKAEFNVFGYFFIGQKTYMMVPTLTMMQQFLTANVGPENVVHITPHLGVSSENEIMLNGETNTRDMGIFFPGIPLEDTADNYCAPTALEYLKHDFYHAFVASHIPKKFRHEYIRFAKCVLELEEEMKHLQVKRFLHHYFLMLIDMDFGLFRTKRSDASFLKRIFLSYFEIIQNLPSPTADEIIKSLGTKTIDEDLFEKLYNIERVKLIHVLVQENVAERLAQKIGKKLGKNIYPIPLIWNFFFAENEALKGYYKNLTDYFSEEEIEIYGHKINVSDLLESVKNKKSLSLTEKFLRNY